MRMFVLLCLCWFNTTSVIAATFVYVSVGGEKKIAIYSQQADDGSLTKVADVPTGGSPGSLAVDPARRFLFASIRSASQLASFRINPSDGHLQPVSAISAGDNAAYVLTDHTGRYLLSAYYGAGKVMVHRIGDDGAVNESPLQSVPTAKNAHCVRFDPSGQFMFVPHTGPNAIYQFVFDRETGKLSANSPSKLVAPDGAGPRHIWFHPELPIAYTSDELGSSVTAYQFDKAAGTLGAVQTLSTLPDGFADRNTCADVEVTPRGKFVYVSNRGHDSIAGFAVDADSGKLTALGQTPTEKTPRSFNIDPAGKHLYAAGQASGTLAAYRIDTTTGKLTRFATYEVGANPSWVQVVETSK